MKKIFLSICCLAFLTNCKSNKSKTKETGKSIDSIQNIYQFTVKNIKGDTFDLSTLKGKKVMIVNTASKCGLTPQYEQLQNLYEAYKDKKFIIIGFPANNFLWQEPGTNSEIASFCSKNYGVTFPMMSKISVKGSDIHPLYEMLTQKSKNGLQNSKVKWNFQKYLINVNGELEMVISPKTLPNDTSVIEWINK
ncbi:MAG: glutathione peroxidase [Flavobacteriaceae bacterium]|nr:glutathione peroxidase [Flavobacteriaceae bacterium]